MSRERQDSGVIDLFAIHKQASEAPPAPSPLASAPPPAFTTDLLGPAKSGPDLGLDLDDENPFADAGKKKKPVYYALAGAGALLVIGVAIAAFSGGSEPAKTAAAAQKPAVTAEAPPPVAAAPPPVQTAEPAPPATTTPAAPSTGAAPTTAKAPAARGGGGARKAAAKKIQSGPKLEKVQSTGVPAK